MGKERYCNPFVPLARLISCSSCVKETDVDENPVVGYLGSVDEQTLRDFEESIEVNAGLLYLTGSKLKKYEARLRQLEEIFLKTVQMPLDSPGGNGSEMSERQAAFSQEPEAERVLPLVRQTTGLGEESDVLGAGNACQELDIARQVRHRITRRGSLGDLRFVPVPKFRRICTPPTRLQSSDSTWLCPLAGKRVIRARSLGDLRQIAFVAPQETSKGLVRLGTTVSTWLPSQVLTRSRSFDDMLDELSVEPQNAGAGLNRLETLFTIWALPRKRRKSSGEGLSSKVIPSVTPCHQSDGLNRLETNVWVWSNPTTKKGFERVLRSRKLLRLRSPAPKRFRSVEESVRREPSPVWVSSSDFDSEAGQSSSRESLSPSPANKGHRREREGWVLDGADCKSADVGRHCKASDGWNHKMLPFGGPTIHHDRTLTGAEKKEVVFSARQVCTACEQGGAGWDEDAVTRLVAEEPSISIIREKPST